MRVTNQNIGRKKTGIKRSHQQLEEFRIGREQFEKKTAQTEGFHETHDGDESGSGIKAEAARETLALLRIVGNRMRLPLRFDLQAMFNAPQKTIRFIESAHFRGRQQFELGDGAQCFQCPLLLQESVLSAMNELERLNNKL